ncbi:M48 family metallopeptidase [Haloarchaeobius sp. DFWS5]|uniref:M48 family metallopeptidase n=1 Tax=Haloarchaeobius sp. DFWS5 TaxID=3446114 RepID=UPI003EB7890A
MDRKLRLSLVVRMAVAVVTLGVFSVVYAVFTGVVITAILSGVVAWIAIHAVDAAMSIPRLSAALPLPDWSSVLFAVGSLALFWWTLRYLKDGLGRSRNPEYDPDAFGGYADDVYDFANPEYEAPPVWKRVGVLFCFLGSLYELVVESIVAVELVLTSLFTTPQLVVGLLALGFLLGIRFFVRGVKGTIRSLQKRTISDAVPADEVDPNLDGTIGRLARQANVPAPTVQVTPRQRPEAFTIGSGPDALLVVSQGLLDVLPDDELEAVLAHEVSHLANGDSRVMAAALAPIVYAEELFESDSADFTDLFFIVPRTIIYRIGQFGVAVLSQGREWAADAGAAELTGSPSSLASALVRLDDRHSVPTQDVRRATDAFAVLDVVPPTGPAGHDWPFRTHPPTRARVARLQRLADEMESA